MSQQRVTSRKGWIASAVVFGLAALFAFVVLTQRQAIADYVIASQYQPTAAVEKIRDSLGLTDKARLLFNASQSELQSAEAFNASCHQRKETNSPVIGCYVNQRIYIYDVRHEKLDGIEETTAAHELLHAVYERMDSKKRAEIDAEIAKVLPTVMTPDLKERLEYYEKTQPGHENNELHSILGTEFPTLSAPLERHYAEYFSSRPKVLAFYERYNSVFESVTTKLESQLVQINSRTRQVNAQIAQYNKSQEDLDADVRAFNQRARRAGGYATQAEYQTDRNALEARRTSLQNDRDQIEQDIGAIKRLTSERATLVEEYTALTHSINSSIAPVSRLDN